MIGLDQALQFTIDWYRALDKGLDMRGFTQKQIAKIFALMVGNPVRRIGWMSRAGERLGDDLICPRTQKYLIRAGLLVEA